MKNLIINTISNIKIKTTLLLLASCLILLSSCGEKKTEEADHEEEKSENEVALTAVQFKTVGIETGSLENRNLNLVIKANGYTTVPP